MEVYAHPSISTPTDTYLQELTPWMKVPTSNTSCHQEVHARGRPISDHLCWLKFEKIFLTAPREPYGPFMKVYPHLAKTSLIRSFCIHVCHGHFRGSAENQKQSRRVSSVGELQGRPFRGAPLFEVAQQKCQAKASAFWPPFIAYFGHFLAMQKPL